MGIRCAISWITIFALAAIVSPLSDTWFGALQFCQQRNLSLWNNTDDYVNGRTDARDNATNNALNNATDNVTNNQSLTDDYVNARTNATDIAIDTVANNVKEIDDGTNTDSNAEVWVDEVAGYRVIYNPPIQFNETIHNCVAVQFHNVSKIGSHYLFTFHLLAKDCNTGLQSLCIDAYHQTQDLIRLKTHIQPWKRISTDCVLWKPTAFKLQQVLARDSVIGTGKWNSSMSGKGNMSTSYYWIGWLLENDNFTVNDQGALTGRVITKCGYMDDAGGVRYGSCDANKRVRCTGNTDNDQRYDIDTNDHSSTEPSKGHDTGTDIWTYAGVGVAGVVVIAAILALVAVWTRRKSRLSHHQPTSLPTGGLSFSRRPVFTSQLSTQALTDDTDNLYAEIDLKRSSRFIDNAESNVREMSDIRVSSDVKDEPDDPAYASVAIVGERTLNQNNDTNQDKHRRGDKPKPCDKHMDISKSDTGKLSQAFCNTGYLPMDCGTEKRVRMDNVKDYTNDTDDTYEPDDTDYGTLERSMRSNKFLGSVHVYGDSENSTYDTPIHSPTNSMKQKGPMLNEYDHVTIEQESVITDDGDYDGKYIECAENLTYDMIN